MRRRLTALTLMFGALFSLALSFGRPAQSSAVLHQEKPFIANLSQPEPAAILSSGTDPSIFLQGMAAQDGKASDDGLWQDAKGKYAAQAQGEGREPKSYRALTLNQIALRQALRLAPMEFTGASTLVMTLPMPDGRFTRFSIEESPVLEAELAARFPEIKTYRGKGIDDPTATTRFDWTPAGFHAMILSASGTVFIEPLAQGKTNNYISYFDNDQPQEPTSFACEVTAAEQETAIATSLKQYQLTPRVSPTVASGETLRTYRLAVAATAEYTQTYGGGTVAGGLSAITTTINLVNAIYERDLAIHLVMVANETAVIFTDPATDGYTSNNIDTVFSQNQAILDRVIGAGNYDIGHVFDGHIFNGTQFYFQGRGNIASVCAVGRKAQGATVFRSLEPSALDAVYVVAHEMGHQFGASHSFNGTTTSDCSGSRVASTAYEPGTGSTIMAYRRICGAEDLRSIDTYFHTASLQQIINYTTIGNGGSCGAQTVTGNNVPVVSAGDAYTIPRGTPFILTATGSDTDGDALTYCWEQYDLGPAAPPNTDDGRRPIFRSFAPTANASRTFPQLSDILSGTSTLGESLPTTTRTMNFRVTVRDNHQGSGGTNSDATQVNVSSNAGPFVVTQPASQTVWAAGSTQTVNWNEANTASAPVNCASVRVLLSVDGGNSFPITLASSVPNTGAATITVPDTPTTAARIKVEAIGNIFFNISLPNFTITPANNAPVLLFKNANYSVAESAGSATIDVVRLGDISGAARIDYSTSDGTARQRTDYTIASGTLNFAAGESSKSFNVLVTDNAYVDSERSVNLILNNPGGTALANPSAAVLTITDNDNYPPTTNPLDGAEFFVRQHYYDFLNRVPDADGLAYWASQIEQCGTDQACINSKRIGVSAAYFIELEFQETGSFVYRLYKASYGQRPTYAQLMPDRSQVVGGANLEAGKQAFAENWVQRAAFRQAYPETLTPEQFVNKLFDTAQLSGFATERQQQIQAMLNGGKTRAQVLRAVIEIQAFKDQEYNPSFVLMQYFGYLRRDPDEGGYDFWLNVLNNREPGNFRGMVCSFITSEEYQRRFSSAVTHKNVECGQ